MNNQLQVTPLGVEVIQRVIAQLDECFRHGFIAVQRERLVSLPSLFMETPLEQPIQGSVEALTRSEYREQHFVSLAAARVALQGALYDLLRHHALSALERPALPEDTHVFPTTDSAPNALLENSRHWLMELALAGLARLEPTMLLSFLPTLSQLRTSPNTYLLSVLLTGFMNEILASLPIQDAAQVPLLRWCDLWSAAMLNAVGVAKAPTPCYVSGTLYPLGVDLHQHPQMARLVVYSVLVTEHQALFVRQTWSSYKVTAIRGDEVWLLFPAAERILQSLMQGKALKLRDMPLLPAGDMLWDEKYVEVGEKYKPREIALRYCASGSSLIVPPLSPLERHPLQISEPVAFTDYRIQDGNLCLKDGNVLAIDSAHTTLPMETLTGAAVMFGLLHYDAGQWKVQPLAGAVKDKYEFVGQAGVQLLKKPPKNSAVSILKERSTRLLRR